MVRRAEKLVIGRVVWYRSRTGAYTVPAVITATVDTLAPELVEAGLIPALSGPMSVHLTVFSPGIPMDGVNATLHADEPPQYRLPPGAKSLNLAGTYQEWDVPFFDPRRAGLVTVPNPAGGVMQGPLRVSCAPVPGEHELEQPPGTWTWPERS
jgi:hypothetical protein